MNWQLAIDRHQKSLLRIVATMFAIIGLDEGNPIERLSKPVYLAVLRLLRPAESAARRLIVVAARGLVVKPAKSRPAPAKPIIARNQQSGRRITFQLFDPQQRFDTRYRFRRHPMPIEGPRPVPRVRVIDTSFDPRIPLFRNTVAAPPLPEPVADNTVSALRLTRRLIAIKAALEDLPRQAKRFARWQARPPESRRPKRASPLRPGTPPGHRKNPVHKVDEILTECHWLARHASRPDTS